jgi:hypothetical protein
MTGPKTSVAVLAGSIAFVVAGLFVLTTSDGNEVQLAGIAAVAFFGGGIPLSLIELRKHRHSAAAVGTIWGIPTARAETLAWSVAASGMALGSYLLRHMPGKPFVELIAWAGACFFGLAAIIFTVSAIRSRNTP